MRQIKNLITLLTVFLAMGLSQSAVAQDSKKEYYSKLEAFRQSFPKTNDSKRVKIVNELITMESSPEINTKKGIAIEELLNDLPGREERRTLVVKLIKSLCEKGDTIMLRNDCKRFKKGTVIKKKNGILTINDKDFPVLTMNDGSVFTGDNYFDAFSVFKTDYNYSYKWIVYLVEDELIPLSGHIVFANGTEDAIIDGITYTEREKARQEAEQKYEQAREKERKKAEQENKKAYAALCKQYGKKYVDAAIQQKPIVGMPEKLLKSDFKLELVEQSTYSKRYHIMGWGWKNFGQTLSNNVHKSSVWVSNGRVTRVIYY
jgi:hypothetical protein